MSSFFRMLMVSLLVTSNLKADNFKEKVSKKQANNTVFETPVKMKTKDGKIIATGDFGHASPALFDINNDGKLDLIVGFYGKEKYRDNLHKKGKFKVYINKGTSKKPLYDTPYLLKGEEGLACTPVG